MAQPRRLFDWIQLMIAPLLLPFVLVPLTEAAMTPTVDEVGRPAYRVGR